MPQPEPPTTSPSGDTHHWAKAGPSGRLRDLTLGDYQVDRLLGSGGMGEVYLARQVSLNREVALKVLRPDLSSNPSYLTRFESEAWAAAKLNDPNIVHIYSLGTIDEIRFIAMEYVQGTNLREFLQKKGPPELMLALSIMRQAGNAVKAAGEVGLVHRDIKPENLLMTRKGLVKVADFGLCHDQDSDRPHVTQPGVTMGTPLYMSPEQAQGHRLDHRSDLYSLGVTFYHMLSGQPPFRAETALALALKHVKETPVDLSVHRTDLPPDLCRLVMKLIEKSPARRYQSAAEMLRDLAKVREAAGASGAGTSGLPVATQAAAAFPTIALADAPLAPAAKPSRVDRSLGNAKIRKPIIAVLLAVGLAAGLVVGWLLRPADLLAAGSKGPSAPPALWMAPDWVEVPKQPGPEAQYRYAQVQAPAGSRVAAWLAVPGHYPAAREWSSRAYNQVARRLFRDRDASRLSVFAAELAKMDRDHEKKLAVILGVAAAVLAGDPEKVVSVFGPGAQLVETLTDPAFAELSLEITLEADRVARRQGLSTTVERSLRQIENGLIRRTVQVMFTDILNRPIGN